MVVAREQLELEHDRLFGKSPRTKMTDLRGLRYPKKHHRKLDKDGGDDEEEDVKPEETTEETNGALVGETRIDLVKLIPFDVKLSLITSTEGGELNTFALTDIVSEWMEESIAAQMKRMELGLTHSAFDSVILEERGLTQTTATATSTTKEDEGTTPTTTTKSSALVHHGDNRRNLEASNTIASYEGVTLWKHTTNSNLQIMTPSLLEDLERQALLQDDLLLELLQASPAEGLGDQVQEVRAYINPNPTTYVPVPNPNPETTTTSTTNANLELIIVVAIVVACMAFAFLVFSLFWAWRFDQQKRDAAYRVDSTPAPPKANSTNKNAASSNDAAAGATEDSEQEEGSPANMNVLVDGNRNQDDDTTLQYPTSETNPTTGLYPESVISEDISTSLSAYYRSGMGSRPLYGSSRANDFNDQASFSSMESYGYSLDGYAPSLGAGSARPVSDGNEPQNP